ncbi:MAG: hypothetical protein GC199_03875 [Alphaproteobacteria bacterium]|nr:hypothetical protein [Alphaproteobacteria bacterium]
MPTLTRYFATPIYEAALPPVTTGALNRRLAASIAALARDDGAGIAWCRENAYPGYTSYGSLNDLAWRDPVFAELESLIAPHVRRFVRALALEMRGRTLLCDSLWVNALAAGGAHSGHIHPGSLISGTYYVAIPKGASAIRFEDPRLGLMMAAPPPRATAPAARQRFIARAPRPGSLLLWESWLRHEVPANGAKSPRLSVSFNYALADKETAR